MALAEGLKACHIRAGALHAEQTLTDHQQALLAVGLAGCGQEQLQLGQVVVAKPFQLGPTGPHAHQQGVVNEAIGQHEAVAIR